MEEELEKWHRSGENLFGIISKFRDAWSWKKFHGLCQNFRNFWRVSSSQVFHKLSEVGNRTLQLHSISYRTRHILATFPNEMCSSSVHESSGFDIMLWTLWNVDLKCWNWDLIALCAYRSASTYRVSKEKYFFWKLFEMHIFAPAEIISRPSSVENLQRRWFSTCFHSSESRIARISLD